MCQKNLLLHFTLTFIIMNILSYDFSFPKYFCNLDRFSFHHNKKNHSSKCMWWNVSSDELRISWHAVMFANFVVVLWDANRNLWNTKCYHNLVIQIAFPRSKLQFDKGKINWTSWEQTPAKYISRKFIFWLSNDLPFSPANGSISQKWIWQIPIIN